MVKFIGVTDCNNEKLLVNIDNILWFKAYEQNKAIMYVGTTGQNDYLVGLIVQESRDTIMRYIISAAK